MVKVITYGTFDLLHRGHIRLLERAKALGDYLIVGVTADDFDKKRGKINVQQSLMERIASVSATGLADEIIVEEYEGQKIDDIKRYEIDIFTVGSDWVGKFDYLNSYCKVIYLERTTGISSSDIRSQNITLKLGIEGNGTLVSKHLHESQLVNGIEVVAAHTTDSQFKQELKAKNVPMCSDFDSLLDKCDAVYIRSIPRKHEEQIRKAIYNGKHVLVESPITLDPIITKELFALARSKNVILMESMKTAYTTAYSRLLLMIKSGAIGEVISIDSVCTSISSVDYKSGKCTNVWKGFESWGPTALLPIFQILGTDKCKESFITNYYDDNHLYDKFTQVNLVYPNAVAVAKVGVGVKSEGQLVIVGTKGYIYVPAPWWKTDYFEIRYEDQNNNKRYFYQLDGEGIRYELVAFAKAISSNRNYRNIDESVSIKISDSFFRYNNNEGVFEISFE